MINVQVLAPREVPLGGPRAMTVRRTLPARERSFIGAWCFVDHYGPDDVSLTGGMDVAPHPHCGLATVSWLFSGEIEHRDSLGTHEMVRPGELNLMTAGRGIAHSEVSTPATTTLHGAQLWVVLPEEAAEVEPRFEHYRPEAREVTPGVWVSCFLGSLAGQSSPVATHTPLLGAEVGLAPGACMVLDVPADFEVGVLVDLGFVEFGGQPVVDGELGVVASGRGVELRAGEDGARVLVLGGPPFPEQVVMWWNFIGRSHEEVVAARADWNDHTPRFGYVDGYVPRPAGADTQWWIPAPSLPGVRLKSRGNRR
ncbi:MAG TPA: pirin family protein [Phycicoccus sp.]|nr:pirin family protein [Phycicoccus sp.]